MAKLKAKDHQRWSQVMLRMLDVVVVYTYLSIVMHIVLMNTDRVVMCRCKTASPAVRLMHAGKAWQKLSPRHQFHQS